MKKEPLLVSACLLGETCRYDGGSQYCAAAAALGERYELIAACPEVLGGMPVPRTPAEIRDGRVVSADGEDRTALFRLGAERTLALACEAGARKALLKSESPSCGRGLVHDGSFSGRLVPGKGVTAALLEEKGITVRTELEISELRGDVR